MIKKLLLVLLVFMPTLLLSQDFTQNWEGLFSYTQIIDASSQENQIYAAARNSIFSYNTDNNQVQTISSVEGISGENVSSIIYTSNNLVIIGYENGLLNTYNPATKEVLKVIDIVEKQTISPDNKRINAFFEVGNQILVATNFGVTTFNLNNQEFGDTYFIGDAGEQLTVRDITVFNNVIYASTENGIRYADLDNPNLIDFQQWETLGQGVFKEIEVFNNKVYTINNSNSLLSIENNSIQFQQSLNAVARDLSATENNLIITLPTEVRILNTALQNTGTVGITEFNPSFTLAFLNNSELYIGDNTRGLLRLSSNNSAQFNYVSPIGPIKNDVFNMEATAGQLWVVYGDYDGFLNPYPLESYGVSHLVDEQQWINLDFTEVAEARSIVEVTVDPKNTGRVFLSSYIDGLVELQDNSLLNFYDQNNSNLEGLDYADFSLRLSGSAFDNQGNFWVLSSKTENGLAQLPAGASDFEIYNLSGIINNPSQYLGLTKLVTDNSGNVFFGTGEDGVVGFNPDTEQFAKVKGTEENQGNLADNYITAMDLDNNGQLWLGSPRGIRVLFGPSSMFNNSNTRAEDIIILDDDGVAQELLADVSITDIEVDGNNNKWVATENGAFYLSSNGQETLLRFTVSNSPLPSNSVQNIEVDDATGTVYFGTDKGLVKYQGRATSGREDLADVRAFPNPVRPTYTGLVTIDGLMENTNVKITDIEGNLVYEEISEGGSIQWDTTAFGRYRVASGVYLVLMTSEDQLETQVTKIMVIR